MTSNELRMQNATRRQQLIEQISAAYKATNSPAEMQRLTLAVVEIGHALTEGICELREAVERLIASLPKKEVKP